MSDEPRLRELAKLPFSASGYVESSSFVFGPETELLCVFERDGSFYQCGFRFVGARAFSFRAESHSTGWHSSAYNRLVEVEESQWLHELLSADPRANSNPWGLRHFLVYVDDEGAYEVAAVEFEEIPEVLVSPTMPSL